MTITVVRLGSARNPNEGLRLGTVRRPPRGVPKAEHASRDFYDVWLPNLSPSAELVGTARASQDEKSWATLVRTYRSEMNAPDAAKILDLLAALSHQTNFGARAKPALQALKTLRESTDPLIKRWAADAIKHIEPGIP